KKKTVQGEGAKKCFCSRDQRPPVSRKNHKPPFLPGCYARKIQTASKCLINLCSSYAFVLRKAGFLRINPRFSGELIGTAFRVHRDTGPEIRHRSDKKPSACANAGSVRVATGRNSPYFA